MRLHINNIVTVRLTQHGANVHNLHQRNHALPKDLPSLYKNYDDTFTAPMWEIMYIFGPYMHKGSENLFTPNEIEV